MKRFIIFTVIILIIITLLVLVFDWGRRGTKLSQIDVNSTSTTEMPIVVNNIKDNQVVSNPIKIVGKARGNWFFEASFPIQLVDADGNILASTAAKAESDWMTNDFVNFNAELTYTKATSTRRALLVLNKDNPSGNPDFDQSIFIPVILK